MPRSAHPSASASATVAALLALCAWAGVALVWMLSPTVHVAPEHEIEAGGAFGIFYFLVAPYLLTSLWVLPSGIAALVRPSTTWALTLTMINSALTCSFAVWMLVGGFDAPFRVLPWLPVYAPIAVVASAVAFLLALASVTPHVTEGPRPHP